VIPIQRYRELGAERCVELIEERVGDAPLYITFDLDCLDASVAPAVSNLEPAFTGFSMDEARQLLHAVRGKDIIGGDVVCLMPTKDSPNQITAMVAAAVMFELIALIAERFTTALDAA
jgi:guanidinopropionase